MQFQETALKKTFPSWKDFSHSFRKELETGDMVLWQGLRAGCKLLNGIILL